MTSPSGAKHPSHPGHAEYLKRRREKYHLKHDEMRAKQLEWEKRNPEKRQGQRDRFDESDSGRAWRREWQRKWRLNNRERFKETTKRSYDKNREEILRRTKVSRAALKAEMIAAYGGKCSCCGEKDPGFLTIDHADNDGHSDPVAKGRRRSGRSGGAEMYRKLRRMGWPQDGYRLQCYNCNLGRAHNGGICPHQAKPLLAAAI